MKLLTLLIFATMLASCHRPAPTGRVVAVVNGEEVTLDEVLAEEAAQGLAHANDLATRRRLLQDVIKRKVLVQEAKRETLDRQANFVLRRRRAEEMLLAGDMMQSISASVEMPTEGDVNRFLHDYPSAFATHVIFRIDQIDVRTGGRTQTIQRIAKMGPLDVVARNLAGAGIVGQRSTTEWDSTFMPAPFVAKLERLPRGVPFVYAGSDTIVVGDVLNRRTILRGYEDRVALVRQNIHQQRIEALVETRMQTVRKATAIEFQSGYETKAWTR